MAYHEWLSLHTKEKSHLACLALRIKAALVPGSDVIQRWHLR